MECICDLEEHKKLLKLKDILDEENYPYFEDSYLQEKLREEDFDDVVQELLIVKSGIEAFELCGIKIPSPKNYFINKLKQHRKNYTGYILRADRR